MLTPLPHTQKKSISVSSIPTVTKFPLTPHYSTFVLHSTSISLIKKVGVWHWYFHYLILSLLCLWIWISFGGVVVIQKYRHGFMFAAKMLSINKDPLTLMVVLTHVFVHTKIKADFLMPLSHLLTPPPLFKKKYDHNLSHLRQFRDPFTIFD